MSVTRDLERRVKNHIKKLESERAKTLINPPGIHEEIRHPFSARPIYARIINDMKKLSISHKNEWDILAEEVQQATFDEENRAHVCWALFLALTLFVSDNLHRT